MREDNHIFTVALDEVQEVVEELEDAFKAQPARGQLDLTAEVLLK